MIRYAYNEQIEPPAPFVHVSLHCKGTGEAVTDLPAQLDTAADRTVIPKTCVERLGLVPLDEIPVGGFGGQVYLLPTYVISLTLRDSTHVMIEAIAHPEEPFVLLGRDVLNRFRIVLDGPRLALEIEG